MRSLIIFTLGYLLGVTATREIEHQKVMRSGREYLGLEPDDEPLNLAVMFERVTDRMRDRVASLSN